MALHLQHCRFDLCRLTDLLQPFRFKIAESDGPHFPLPDRLFTIPPCAHIIAYLLMQKKQVNGFYPKAFQHFVNSGHGLTLAVLTGPELRCYPDFLPGNAAFPDCGAYAALVLVSVGRINMTVAHLKGIQNRPLCLLSFRHHIYAHAKLRDFCPIV